MSLHNIPLKYFCIGKLPNYQIWIAVLVMKWLSNTFLCKANDELQGNNIITWQNKPCDSCNVGVSNKNIIGDWARLIIGTSTIFAGQYKLQQTQQPVYNIHQIGLSNVCKDKQDEIGEDGLAPFAKLALSLLIIMYCATTWEWNIFCWKQYLFMIYGPQPRSSRHDENISSWSFVHFIVLLKTV